MVIKKMINDRSKMALTVAKHYSLVNPEQGEVRKFVPWSAIEKRVRAGIRWEGVKLVLIGGICMKLTARKESLDVYY